MKYHFTFNVAFGLESDCRNPLDIPEAALMAALLERVRDLQSEHANGNNVGDDFACEEVFEHATRRSVTFCGSR